MAFNWYPFNPLEYRRDTYHLCAAADGIYRRLIDEYMLTSLPLPDSNAALAGIARVGQDEFNSHSAILRAFFKSKDGKLFHKRCEQEIHAQRMLAAARSHKAKEAATIRWAKEKLKQQVQCSEHAYGNANAMLTDATLHNKVFSLTSSEYVEGQKAIERRRPSDLSRSDLDAVLSSKKRDVV